MMSSSAFGQSAGVSPELGLELAYIRALTDARLPEYAALVLKDIKVKYPTAGAILKKLELEQVLQTGRFDAAKAMIAAEPNPESPETWLMTLTMADYYYGHGKYKEALGIYKGFFDKYKAKPPVDIEAFYAESYYKFTQMLLFLNMEKEALAAYDDFLKLKLDTNTKRQAQFESAELTVKLAEAQPKAADKTAMLLKARKSAEDLMWSQDLWFGRSLVLLAHIHVINGDIAKANKLVKDYMPQLRNLDQQLIEQSKETGEDLTRLSPIAECRFLMGVMMADEADKILAGSTPDINKATELLSNALNELVNVYVKYPSTAWAPDALARSEEIQTILKEKCGIRDIQIDISPEQRKAIAQKQFANARMLFNQQQFEKAIVAYELVLNQFPEVVPESVMALSEFARSYVQLGDTQEAEAKQYSELCAGAVIGHLAERFSKSTKEGMTLAGDELRRIAEFYGERNLFAQRDATYNLFFSLYPEHPLAASLLMSTAEKLYKAEDYAGAVPNYTTLMNVYVKSALSFTAMQRLAECYSKLGDVEKELEIRKTYVERVEKREKPGQDLIVGKYMLTRLKRNEGIRRLRAANEKFEAARKAAAAGQPAETPPPAEGEAAPVDPLVAAETEVKKANQELVAAVNELGKIMTLLGPATRAKYEENDKQKEINDNILQGCYFDRAYTLSSITQPAEQVPQLKTMAIKTYEELLVKFPKAEGAPAVLMQIGTLLSTLKTSDPKEQEENMKKADAVFTRLSTEYPQSEQAKNAYFLRGRTLIELGFRAEGVAVLKKMFGDAGKYSAGQMLSAALELLKSQEYEMAREGFNLAVSMAKGEASITIPAELGLAEVLVAEKKFTEAVAALEKFIAANAKSYKVIEANALLGKAAALAAYEEPDADKRVKLFNSAITAIRLVRQMKNSQKDLAESEIAIGKILETKAEVAKKFKDQALVDRYIGEAASHYQQFIMSADRRNADVLPSLETAYRQAIKLTLEMKVYKDGSPVYEDVKNDCEAYLGLFPNGRYTTDVRAFLTEAEIGLSTTPKKK